jgi:hypothetical protein
MPLFLVSFSLRRVVLSYLILRYSSWAWLHHLPEGVRTPVVVDMQSVQLLLESNYTFRTEASNICSILPSLGFILKKART